MNTTLGAGEHTGAGTEQHTIVVVPAGRLGLIDRTAMRLGLALILWGQRPTRRRPAGGPLTSERVDELLRMRRAGADAARERHAGGRALPPIL
ncbi:hypothetical protein ACFSBZ_05820 [Amnibacterium flavum]|uniref:Uncharacterized protein n=1 Tax=Amnibacterium flavum TaxID=2173173 RepID=A0A2V1HN08_9MICO|nr:hypothetical protein [Amnibacterium flavum]PVZ94013.1 hypothetical protein DDQ50_09660 [Amnibacterium flavum]